MSELDQILALGNPLATLSSYFNQLYPASWRGVPFFVDSAETGVGRRNAEHVYPFRDTPWQEDIGRKGRKYEFSAFLVGDDVITQRAAMQAAAEQKGPGTLVHPTYGTLTVSLLECNFREHKSHGRVIEINFRFGESGQRLYPSNGSNTGMAVVNAGSLANQAMSDSFVSQVTQQFSSAQQQVVAAVAPVTEAYQTVSGWVGEAVQLGKEATNIYNLGANMVGSFGRFFGGKTGSSVGSIVGSYVPPSQVASQVANLINTATADRGNIAGAATNISTILEGL